jgi:hypothetical protein
MLSLPKPTNVLLIESVVGSILDKAGRGHWLAPPSESAFPSSVLSFSNTSANEEPLELGKSVKVGSRSTRLFFVIGPDVVLASV